MVSTCHSVICVMACNLNLVVQNWAIGEERRKCLANEWETKSKCRLPSIPNVLSRCAIRSRPT